MTAASPSCSRRATAGRSRWRSTVGARTVAFPAVSTGIYGYPVDAAAEIAVRSVLAFDHGGAIDVVRLVAFDQTALDSYTALLTGSPD